MEPLWTRLRAEKGRGHKSQAEKSRGDWAKIDADREKRKADMKAFNEMMERREAERKAYEEKGKAEREAHRKKKR
jgi:hypothetical protein